MATDAEIGIHLDLNTRSVRELRAKGVLPAPGADLDTCRVDYIRHMRESAAGRVKQAQNGGLEGEKARLAHEQADQVALRNALARKELVPLGPITQAVIGMIEVAKAKLKRVPAKVAPGDATLKARIADAIEDALIDLSADRAISAPAPADDE